MLSLVGIQLKQMITAKERADLAADEYKRAISWLRENREVSLDEKKTYLMDKMDIKNNMMV